MAEITQKEFVKFKDLIYQSCGISLDERKVPLVQARLGKRIRNLKLTSFNDYYKYICEDIYGDEMVQLLDAISTNTTHFFREENHFTFLKQIVLPEFIEYKKKSKDRKLRVWSAACSSGEEPYSIAMTVVEKIADNSSWDFKILATDISTKVLKMAFQGIYEEEKLKKISRYLIDKYFYPYNNSGEKLYKISEKLQKAITFRRLNLISDSFPFKGPFDFIFCRNVMIYFDKETRETLMNKIYKYLAEGGYLFIGASESLSGIQHNFKYVCPAIYKK